MFFLFFWDKNVKRFARCCCWKSSSTPRNNRKEYLHKMYWWWQTHKHKREKWEPWKHKKVDIVHALVSYYLPKNTFLEEPAWRERSAAMKSLFTERQNICEKSLRSHSLCLFSLSYTWSAPPECMYKISRDLK
jgi:hypothetical protein